MSGGTGSNTGGVASATGTVGPSPSERIEAVQRPATDFELRREHYDADGPQWVVNRAEAELVARYGGLDDSELGLTHDMFKPPAGAFLVVRADAAGPPIGGVGLRRVAPGRGEVKRLWVDPGWRGLGLGRALMEALERSADEIGLRSLQLDTGDRQPEAVALYLSSGWSRIFVDGDGTPLPARHIRFAKEVTPGPVRRDDD